MSMRVMSAGSGYRYLLSSVVAADADRPLRAGLIDYYTAAGTPPGRWFGGGLAALGGDLQPGDVVEEEHLRLLLGEGRDPISGAQLGRAYPRFAPVTEPQSESGNPGAKSAAPRRRRAVAGYDLTFSVPKSVSVVWALGVAAIRQAVVDAHHGAIGDVLGLLEREVASTRTGATGPDGPVAHVDVEGLIATAFDHFDSRAGDPQLHTHVVISNKVRTSVDGRWRSLDGRALFASDIATNGAQAHIA